MTNSASDDYSAFDEYPSPDLARDDATLVLLLDIDRALRHNEDFDPLFTPFIHDGFTPILNPPHVIHPPVRGSSALVVEGEQMNTDGIRRKVAIKYIVRIFGLHDPDVYFDTPKREIAEPYYLYRAAEVAPQAVLCPLASYSLLPFPGHILIMPLVEKDLVDVIHESQVRLQRTTDNRAAVLEEMSDRWQFIFARLVQGVAELHRGMVAHMDMKPDNILIVDGMIPKIIDFSSACSTEKQLTGKLVTTFPYAPARCMQRARHIRLNKQLECDPYDSDTNYPNPAKIDSYSLGCTLFEMYFGRTPCSKDVSKKSAKEGADQQHHKQHHIEHVEYYTRESRSDESDTRLGNECCMRDWDGTVQGRSYVVLPDGALDIIRKLVVQDSRLRATVEELLSHSWIQEGLRKSGPETTSERSASQPAVSNEKATDCSMKRRKV